MQTVDTSAGPVARVYTLDPPTRELGMILGAAHAFHQATRATERAARRLRPRPRLRSQMEGLESVALARGIHPAIAPLCCDLAWYRLRMARSRKKHGGLSSAAAKAPCWGRWADETCILEGQEYLLLWTPDGYAGTPCTFEGIEPAPRRIRPGQLDLEVRDGVLHALASHCRQFVLGDNFPEIGSQVA